MIRATGGQSNLQAAYERENWVNYEMGLSWPKLRHVCWHDSWPQGPTSGNGVAITPRHILVSEHGTEVPGYQLQWAISLVSTVTRSTAGYPNYRSAIGAYDYNGSGDYQGYELGFRVLYLTEDMPLDLVCPLLHPSNAPNFSGVPVVSVQDNGNAQNPQSVIWDINYATASHYAFFLEQAADSQRAKFWKAAITGDSGSPVFLVFTNELGTRLVYFGHITNAGASGPSYFYHHDAIINACQELNAAFPNNPQYLPTYV